MNGSGGGKENEKKSWKKIFLSFEETKAIRIFLDNEIMVSCDEGMKLKVSHTKSPGVMILSESPLHEKSKRP